MEMTSKKAFDPNRGEYEIELPIVSLVKEALLVLDYSRGAIKIENAAEILAERFALTDDQKNAKHRNGFNIYKHYVANAAGALVNKGELVRLRTGWVAKPGKENGGVDTTENPDVSTEDQGNGDEVTSIPEESIEENYQEIRKNLEAELLQQIQVNSSTFFEELVIDLLVAMGYGGSREDAQTVGRSRDGGIDGIINEDRLGLDVIYVQAKRWESNVGEPPLRDFVGALDGKGVQKGIFITTSDFSPAAKNYAERSSKKVILINGDQLADYMIEHNVGVSIEKTYEIKRVDSDYFSENTENA